MSRKAFLCIFFVMIWLSGCNSSNKGEESAKQNESVPVADLINQADELYKQRENLDRLREGIALLKRARSADSKNYEANWKLAKFDYYLGSHTEDEKESEQAFKEGISSGRVASNIFPNKPDGYFWTGANRGGKAQKSPFTEGLTSIDDIRRDMSKVIEIQPDYQGASAYDVLAQVELGTLIMGGDAGKAADYLEKAISLEPNNSNSRLHLAEAYLSLNRKDDARKQLEYIVRMKPDPNYLPEYQVTLERARKLLKSRF